MLAADASPEPRAPEPAANTTLPAIPTKLNDPPDTAKHPLHPRLSRYICLKDRKAPAPPGHTQAQRAGPRTKHKPPGAACRLGGVGK